MFLAYNKLQVRLHVSGGGAPKSSESDITAEYTGKMNI